jgi:putative membrane protein
LLGAGLIWSSLIIDDFHVMLFFLTCVIIAGLYGAATANRKILYVQALPAIIALVLLHLH